MKNTNYSKIAGHYDKNPIRHHQPKELLIEEILRVTDSSINILDIACGTGNFLKAQQEAYTDKRIKWFGCDLSQEMLAIAHKKVSHVEFIKANAVKLPYKNNSFNFITCNYAFHHFFDKYKSIQEIYRILKPNGAFLIKNMCLEHMPLSWIYYYFPQTKRIDRRRFWSNQKLFSILEEIGFKVDIKVEVFYKRFDINEITNEAENRDMSQLNLISDKKYNKGMKRIHKDMKLINSLISEFANLRCVAFKA